MNCTCGWWYGNLVLYCFLVIAKVLITLIIELFQASAKMRISNVEESESRWNLVRKVTKSKKKRTGNSFGRNLKGRYES